MSLDRDDREALGRLGTYVAALVALCVLLLVGAVVCGAAVHLFRVVAGV